MRPPSQSAVANMGQYLAYLSVFQRLSLLSGTQSRVKLSGLNHAHIRAFQTNKNPPHSGGTSYSICGSKLLNISNPLAPSLSIHLLYLDLSLSGRESSFSSHMRYVQAVPIYSLARLLCLTTYDPGHSL